MNGKISEILESGIAPGVHRGLTNEDHSAAVKVPKALAAVESEPAYPHGPARGARGISKHFGMSTDMIKRVWKMACIAFLACLVAGTATAGDLTTGFTFFDGQIVSAANLNSAVNAATINSSFYTGKPLQLSPLSSDYFVIWSPTASSFYRVPMSSVLPNGYTNAASGLPTSPDLVLFYSISGAGVQSTTVSNLSLSLPFRNITNGMHQIETYSNVFNVFGTGVGKKIDAAHSLDGAPQAYKFSLLCKTADFGYQVGDEIDLSTVTSSTGVGLSAQSHTFGVNSTNVWMWVLSTPCAQIKTNATVLFTNLTPANWLYKVTAEYIKP